MLNAKIFKIGLIGQDKSIVNFFLENHLFMLGEIIEEIIVPRCQIAKQPKYQSQSTYQSNKKSLISFSKFHRIIKLAQQVNPMLLNTRFQSNLLNFKRRFRVKLFLLLVLKPRAYVLCIIFVNFHKSVWNSSC